MGLLGAHVSTAGGLHKAFERGAALGCQSMQIFVKSPNQWRGKVLTEPDVAQFKESHAANGEPVVAHAAYLINLASPKAQIHAASKAGLLDELTRVHRLGLGGLVLHPGGHLGEGVEVGIEQIARSLDEVMASPETGDARLLLENTAGQGTSIGARFEELAAIIELVDAKDRIGVCLDSCHAFSAGYALNTQDGYEAMFASFDESIGLERLEAVHINDSKHPLGSRKDRHANIGEGLIGEEFFARLLVDEKLTNLPLVLETPLGDDDLGHERDLDRLRSLLA
ncbi:MAG TPA: deoxyribonuclease IV [Trueperaceae bacterium]|nr:deoxyribonuclease IV [Trueperaceae bacterium]